MAVKKFYADIELHNSHVTDADGNIISLSKDQRNAVANASTTGATASNTNPLTTKDYVDTSVETLKEQLLSNVSWRDPIDTVSAETITAPSESVKSYLNMTDQKIYRSTDNTTWDVVEVPAPNWCVVVKDSDEQYTYDSDTSTWKMTSTGAIPDATKTSKGKVSIGDNIDVTNGVISVKSGTTSHAGVVQVATDKESNENKVLSSADSRILVGYAKMSFVDQTTIVFTHSLGSTDVIVQVYVGSQLVDADVNITSENAVTVTLSEQCSGKVLVVAL